MTDKNIEKMAFTLANNIDSNSLNLLRKFCFGKRGDLEFWQRVSEDSSLYSFSQSIRGDSVELILFRPFNFIKDFSTNYQFDTSLYYQFRFSKLKDSIVRLVAVNNQGQENTNDTLVHIKQIFPDKDPFATLAILTAIKDKFGFVGTSYGGDIGDFIEFSLSPQFKLTFLPDTSNMNPKFKKYWLADFSNGKQIKEHLSLQKVYDR